MARSVRAQPNQAWSAAAIPASTQQEPDGEAQWRRHRHVESLDGEAGDDERQSGAHPREEGALVREAEAGVGILAAARRPSGGSGAPRCSWPGLPSDPGAASRRRRSSHSPTHESLRSPNAVLTRAFRLSAREHDRVVRTAPTIVALAVLAAVTARPSVRAPARSTWWSDDVLPCRPYAHLRFDGGHRARRRRRPDRARGARQLSARGPASRSPRPATARPALASLEAGAPDLVVLDLTLPRLDGLEVFRRMRALRGDLPVVMLTARGEESDRVLGLEVGADDYITKPFSNRELVLRVQSILRRVAAAPPRVGRPTGPGAAGRRRSTAHATQTSSTVTSWSTAVATRSGSATRRSPLTVREYDLLVHLMATPGTAHSPAGAHGGRLGMGLRRRGHRDGARAPSAREGRARPVAAASGSRRSGASATAGTARVIAEAATARGAVTSVVVGRGRARCSCDGPRAGRWPSRPPSPRSSSCSASPSARSIAARAMFISDHDRQVVIIVIGTCLPVAALFGWLIARQVQRARSRGGRDRRRARARPPCRGRPA